MEESLQRPPLLSSKAAGWEKVQVEYHRQPAHAIASQIFPVHIVEVGLRYDASALKVNGRLYESFAPGNIAIHPAHEPISIESYGEAEFIAIALQPALFSTTAEKPLESIELIPQFFGQDPLIFHLALALKQALKQPNDPFYAESMATALTAHLLQQYTGKPEGAIDCAGGLSTYQRQQIVNYVHTHLNQPLNLSSLAGVVAMSPHYFATLFKQSMGTSPYQYVIQCRIERAKKLLACSQLKIVDIGYQVGLHSQSHFTKVFRDRTSVTPSTYRKSL